MYKYTKSLILCGLLLTQAFSQTQTRWGLPEWFEMSTYAVNDYNPSLSDGSNKDLDRSLADATQFATQLKSKINAKYPNVYANWSIKRENWDATKANFTADNTNNNEALMFRGHGNAGKIFFGNWATADRYTKQFGGYTKWVFFNSCLTMDQTVPELSYYFNGAHAIFGHLAFTYEFINSYSCSLVGCNHHRSEDVWADFATRWITNGETIWDAYKYSMQSKVYSMGSLPGLRPKVAYIVGTGDNGQAFSGDTERFQNVYNGPIYGTVGTRSISFGTPQYN